MPHNTNTETNTIETPLRVEAHIWLNDLYVFRSNEARHLRMKVRYALAADEREKLLDLVEQGRELGYTFARQDAVLISYGQRRLAEVHHDDCA